MFVFVLGYALLFKVKTTFTAHNYLNVYLLFLLFCCRTISTDNFNYLGCIWRYIQDNAIYDDVVSITTTLIYEMNSHVKFIPLCESCEYYPQHHHKRHKEKMWLLCMKGCWHVLNERWVRSTWLNIPRIFG